MGFLGQTIDSLQQQLFRRHGAASATQNAAPPHGDRPPSEGQPRHPPQKPRVLIFTFAYLPGYRAGGPIQSIANMVAALKAEFAFSIVTSSWDLGATGPYADVPEGRWLEQEGVRLLYLPRARTTMLSIAQVVANEAHDYIYFNGLFDPLFTLLPLSLLRFWPSTRRPKLIVAPRGMLGPGALQQKAQKKALFIALARAIDLLQAVRFHATASEEAGQVLATFGPAADVHVASNLMRVPNVRARCVETKKPGSARFFFLSRVDPKKNLPFALDALAALPRTADFHFTIIGPEHHEAHSRELREKLSPELAHRVSFIGAIPHAQIGEALAQQHFLILPTLDENFGHAILESMLHGCPVVISEHTPWHGLAAQQVGWDLPLEQTPWVTTLKRCLDMTGQDFVHMSNAARAFALNVARNDHLLADSRALFSP